MDESLKHDTVQYYEYDIVHIRTACTCIVVPDFRVNYTFSVEKESHFSPILQSFSALVLGFPSYRYIVIRAIKK